MEAVHELGLSLLVLTGEKKHLLVQRSGIT